MQAGDGGILHQRGYYNKNAQSKSRSLQLFNEDLENNLKVFVAMFISLSVG